VGRLDPHRLYNPEGNNSRPQQEALPAVGKLKIQVHENTQQNLFFLLAILTLRETVCGKLAQCLFT
jgi:hypothetical protein